jgi:hypothetical protein
MGPMKKSDNAVRAIRAASTESQVIGALHDYVSSLDAAEVALLPAEIMAFGLAHAEEAVQSALYLVHTQMLRLGDSPEAAVLNEVTLVFSSAARRLAALAKDTT